MRQYDSPSFLFVCLAILFFTTHISWSLSTSFAPNTISKISKSKQKRNSKKQQLLLDALKTPLFDHWPLNANFSSFDRLKLVDKDIMSSLKHGTNTMVRLNAMFEKALRGENITVLVLGGSSTNGADLGCLSRRCNYHYALDVWWNRIVGPATKSYMIRKMVAIGGIGTAFMSHCWHEYVDTDAVIDLVIWEFAINDPDSHAHQYAVEQFIRSISTHKSKPALLFSCFFLKAEFPLRTLARLNGLGDDTDSESSNSETKNKLNGLNPSMITKPGDLQFSSINTTYAQLNTNNNFAYRPNQQTSISYNRNMRWQNNLAMNTNQASPVKRSKLKLLNIKNCNNNSDHMKVLFEVVKYYKLTAIDLKHEICKYFLAGHPHGKLAEKEMFIQHHPSHLAHAQMAFLIVTYMQRIGAQVMTKKLQLRQPAIKFQLPVAIQDSLKDAASSGTVCWTADNPNFKTPLRHDLFSLQVNSFRHFRRVSKPLWTIETSERYDVRGGYKANWANSYIDFRVQVPKIDSRSQRDLYICTSHLYNGGLAKFTASNNATQENLETIQDTTKEHFKAQSVFYFGKVAVGTWNFKVENVEGAVLINGLIVE